MIMGPVRGYLDQGSDRFCTEYQPNCDAWHAAYCIPKAYCWRNDLPYHMIMYSTVAVYNRIWAKDQPNMSTLVHRIRVQRWWWSARQPRHILRQSGTFAYSESDVPCKCSVDLAVEACQSSQLKKYVQS